MWFNKVVLYLKKNTSSGLWTFPTNDDSYYYYGKSIVMENDNSSSN